MTGVTGALAQLWPAVSRTGVRLPPARVCGASGAICGLLAYAAAAFPETTFRSVRGMEDSLARVRNSRFSLGNTALNLSYAQEQYTKRMKHWELWSQRIGLCLGPRCLRSGGSTWGVLSARCSPSLGCDSRRYS